ncbi:hypothetical protein ACI2TF_09805 [Ralstonia nicotianae]
MATNKKLSATIQIGGAISSSLGASFRTVTTGIGGIGKAVTDLERRQRMLGRAIQDFGRAGKDITGMRNRYAELTAQLDRTRRAQERLVTAQATAAKIGSITRGAGVAVGAGVGAMGLLGRPLIREARGLETVTAQTRALGFGKEDTEHGLTAAASLKAFGVSIKDATEIVRDGMAGFGDVHHALTALPTMAKMSFANRAIFGEEEGKARAHQFLSLNKAIELRGGMATEDEYRKQANLAQQVMSATGGRVNGETLQEFIGRGGIAAKGLSNEAFFYKFQTLMQEMGGAQAGTGLMSLYQGLAQGHVTKRAANNLASLGLIGDASKVKHDKAGQLSFLNPGALIGYEMFAKDPFAWTNKYLVPVLEKRGALKDPQKTAEVIGSIVSNRTGANMLATMVMQRAQIEKDARVAAQADNIDQLEARAKGTSRGKELNAEARYEDAKARMGTALLPTYAFAMEKAASALEAFNRFADQSPAAFKTATFAFFGLTGAVTALATIGATTKLATIGLSTTMGTLSATLGTVSANAGKAQVGLMGFLGRLGLAGALSSAALAGAKALGLPDVDPKKGAQDVKAGNWWAASAHLNPVDFASAAWGHMTGGDKQALPVAPSMATARGTTAPVTNNNSYAINITAAPGMDERRIGEIAVRELERREGIQMRSRMYDGPSR